MKSKVTELCQFCEEQKQNRSACDTAIIKFLKEAETDQKYLSEMSADPSLPTFLKMLFKTLTRQQFPSPTEAIILPLYLQILHFLTTIASNHPDLLNSVAESAPMDELPSVFFGRNIANDKIIDVQSSHLLASLKFLFVISCSRALATASIPSLHVLFIVLIQLLKVKPFSALAAGTLSGLAHNCPSATDFLRSSPEFSRLKSELVSLLSSNDHNVVIASMSAISGLFSVGSDSQVLIKIALKGLLSPPSLPMATILCVWTLLDLNAGLSITPPSYIDIVNAMLDSDGMRAFHILCLLKKLCGAKCLPILCEDNLFAPILGFVIHSKCDFVSAAGAQFIQIITEHAKTLPFDTDTVHLFAAALDIVMTADNGSSLIRIEAMLLILRSLIKMEAFTGKWTKILQVNEANLLSGFQRQVEKRNTFVALAYFLFLVDCVVLNKLWQVKLARVVEKSRFCSIVVEILSRSSSHEVLSDACRAAALISIGVTPSTFSPLMDSLVSEFVSVNSNQSEQCNIGVKIKHCLQGVRTTKSYQKVVKVNESECLVSATGSEVAVSREQILHLKEEIRLRTKKGRDLKNTVNDLSREIAELKTELAHKMQTLKERDQVAATMKERIRAYKEIELQLKEMTVSRDLLIKENSDLRKDLTSARALANTNADAADNEKLGRQSTETRMLELSNQLSETQKKLHEQERLTRKTEKRTQKLILLLNQKGAKLTESEETNRKLLNQVNELQLELNNAEMLAVQNQKQMDELRHQLAETEGKTKDQLTLCQFIHKLTENKGLEDTFSESDM